MFENVLPNVWSEWQIVRLTEQDSYGATYEVMCAKEQRKMAVKVISVPQDEAEAASLRAKGFDEEALKTYFYNVANNYVGRIRMMGYLKNVYNIVAVEDYTLVEKSGTSGWDIYIRMEPVVSFQNYISRYVMAESAVAKLGGDICTALEALCGQGKIHGDIRPENIYVNERGDFKLFLGFDHVNPVGAYKQRKDLFYVAPEVEREKRCDLTADLYSLGMVLYCLLNHNRIPFLSANNQWTLPDEYTNAVQRRLNGEAIPAPCMASPNMTELINCACDPDPGRRFASPSAMKNALLAVAGETENNAYGFAARQGNMQVSVATQEIRNKKTRKKPVLIASLSTLAVIIFVGVGIFVWPILFGEKETGNKDGLIVTGNDKDKDKDNDENNEKKDILAICEEYADKGDYASAIEEMTKALNESKDNAEYQSALRVYKVLYREDVIEKAETSLKEKSVPEVVKDIQKAVDFLGGDAELVSKQQELEKQYENEAIRLAEEIIERMGEAGYETAEKRLEEMWLDFPDNQGMKDELIKIKNLKAEAETAKKVKPLLSGGPEYETYATYTDASYTIDGQVYTDGFYMRDEYGGSLYFDLNGNYSLLTFDIGHVDDRDFEVGHYNIYVDGKLVCEMELDPYMKLEHHEIPLEGAKELSIIGGPWGWAFAIVNPKIVEK